jgi:CHAT domain-containing protein
MEGIVTSQRSGDATAIDISGVRHLLLTDASPTKIIRALRALPLDSIAELGQQFYMVKTYRDRRVRPWGPPAWIFAPREEWILSLLDEAQDIGIAQALESAPEIPPLGPWAEFLDLAIHVLFADSLAQIKDLMASDTRIRKRELYEAVSHMEWNSDTSTPESAFIKVRAKWLLWVLQRERQVGHEQAIAESPPLPADQSGLFANWNVLTGPAAELFPAYDRSGDIGDLEQLTAYLTRMTTAEAAVSDAVALQQAGARWLERYRQTHEAAEFAPAAALLGSAIGAFPRRHVGAAHSRCMLADLYHQRWQQAADPQDVCEAARLLAEAADDLPADDTLWPACMTRLGHLLLVRYETEGDSAVLAQAMEVIDRLCTEERADLDTWLVGVSLRVWGLLQELKSGASFEPHLSTVLDLVAEAIEQADTAVTTANLPGRLTAIGMRCREVSQWTGGSRFAAAAAAVSHSALRLLPQNGEAWWSEALNLSATLTLLCQDDPDPALPDEALALLDIIRSESPPGWDRRLELLQTQAVAARSKFSMTADPQWAEFSLRAAREALSLAQQQDRHVSACMVTVAMVLFALHERTGSPVALDEAISLLQDAAGLASEQDNRLVFNSLGAALNRRFGLYADIHDIDAAISALETAAQAAGPGMPPMHDVLNNLSLAFVQKSLRTKEPALLDKAIGCLEEAVRHASGANRTLLLARLAGTLLERSRYTDDLADLEHCIELSEEVFQDPGHLHRRTMLTALAAYGTALRRRYSRGGSRASDLDRAVGALERALPEARDDAANGPAYLRDLALAYRDRYRLTGVGDDLQRGIALFKESVKSAETLNPAVALDSALLLGNWSESRDDWLEAAEAYRAGLKAISRLVTTQALRGHKESWLQEAQTLPARAAYALVRCDQIEEAVLALENGQALLLNEALEQDVLSTERLRAEGHDTLADRYLQAEAQISALRAIQSAFPDAAPVRADADPEQVKSELDDVLDEMITVSGRLIAPVTLSEIAEAAAERPLVYVTFSPEGGAALLIDKHGTVSHIPLPMLTATALDEKLLPFIEAYQHRNVRPRKWPSAIDEVTRWLWTALMEPVVAQGHPAVTMIPAGALWMLPLHLAWRPADSPTGRRYALDDILLVFAPNARALNRRTNTDVRSILMVENPESPIAPPLAYASDEAEGALQHFTSDQQELLRGPEATCTNVLAALSSYDCLHFACHGRAEPGRPLDNALLLSDAKLRLRDIMTARTTARLVVLSACETAVTGTALPDEVVGLPVGFLQAGAAGVIGSLWAVPDKTTAILMTRFYHFWQSENEPPAQALRHAQQQLRDKIAQANGPEGAHPLHWGAFTYIGR